VKSAGIKENDEDTKLFPVEKETETAYKMGISVRKQIIMKKMFMAAVMSQVRNVLLCMVMPPGSQILVCKDGESNQ
jgi:hypothetical protein